MYNKTLLLFVFVFFNCFLISCRSKRQEVQKELIKSEITSENIVTYQDTTIYTPKSETSLKIPVAETVFKNDLNSNLTPRVFTQKNGNSTVKVKIVRDTIYATATCDSLAIAAKIKKQLLKQASKSETNKSDEVKTKTGYTLWDLILSAGVGFGICFVLKLFKVL